MGPGAYAGAASASRLGRASWGVGDDRAQRTDKAAEILRVLVGELRTTGLEELAASVCECSGDERVAGSEVGGRASLSSSRGRPEAVTSVQELEADSGGTVMDTVSEDVSV